jgi:cytochrome c biogenesis protein CcdA
MLVFKFLIGVFSVASPCVLSLVVNICGFWVFPREGLKTSASDSTKTSIQLKEIAPN